MALLALIIFEGRRRGDNLMPNKCNEGQNAKFVAVMVSLSAHTNASETEFFDVLPTVLS